MVSAWEIKTMDVRKGRRAFQKKNFFIQSMRILFSVSFFMAGLGFGLACPRRNRFVCPACVWIFGIAGTGRRLLRSSIWLIFCPSVWFVCSSKSATIGKNMQRIGKKAFLGCKNLNKINIRATKFCYP